MLFFANTGFPVTWKVMENMESEENSKYSGKVGKK